MRLIGLGGYAGAGKDETAKVLVEQHGFTRVAFADLMREFIYRQNPIITFSVGEPIYLQHIVDLYGWDWAKRTYPEVRRLLQATGNEAAKPIFGKSCWVDLAFEVARAAGGPVVFTDARFDVECYKILNCGGEIWDVVRPGVGPVNAHASDAGEWKKHATRTVWNIGTLSDLSYQIFGMVQGV